MHPITPSLLTKTLRCRDLVGLTETVPNDKRDIFIPHYTAPLLVLLLAAGEPHNAS